MTRIMQPTSFLVSSFLLTLTAACSPRTQADPTPDFAVSPTDEGVAPGRRSGTKSPRMSGDTLICDKSRKYSTPDGSRWLWVRILVERQPGATDFTLAETAVSTDAEGMEYDPEVDLAGIKLDDGREYTLRNTPGVRTRETKKGDRQAHWARGYARGPDLGPIDLTCGGS
jgi:hypothetical protein